MNEAFGEAEVVGIGEGVAQLLREWTLDIRKAIVDVQSDENRKGDPIVNIGMKVKILVYEGKAYPTVEMKFATGKKISDVAEINPQQAKLV